MKPTPVSVTTDDDADGGCGRADADGVFRTEDEGVDHVVDALAPFRRFHQHAMGHDQEGRRREGEVDARHAQELGRRGDADRQREDQRRSGTVLRQADEHAAGNAPEGGEIGRVAREQHHDQREERRDRRPVAGEDLGELRRVGIGHALSCVLARLEMHLHQHAIEMHEGGMIAAMTIEA